MIQNLVFVAVVMGTFVAVMGSFGAWCGLGWGFSLGLATGGMFCGLFVMAVIGGVVQMILAKRADQVSLHA